MNETLDPRITEAQRLREFGLPLIRMRGKTPIDVGWLSGPLLPGDDILSHAAGDNVGVRCGHVDGASLEVVVVDIDLTDADRVRQVATELGLATTWTVRTGRGGFHCYYRMPQGVDIRNSVSKLSPKVDVRGTGGCIVAPGSIHPDTGKRYEWVTGRSPNDIELVPLPPSLSDRLNGAQRSAPLSITPGTRVPVGQRNDFAGARGWIARCSWA